MTVENQSEIFALELLGWELKNKDWQPSFPTAQPFDGKERKASDAATLGRQYLESESDRIRLVLCEGKEPRIEIMSATSTGAAVADALLSAGGFIVPVTTLANAVLALGLHRYCKA